MNMKKISIFVASLLVSAASMAQNAADPVLMHINGNPITRSAFEYSFNKNNAEGVIDKKDVEEYVQLFIDFKLKVEAAKDAGIDTLQAIRKELHGYREQMVLPTLVDSNFIEQQARLTYDNTAKRFGGEDLLKASHILVLMRQDATPEQQAAAKFRIDSIYTVLKGGADFAEVAKASSDDKGSAQRGGALGEFGKGMMIPDFEKAAYALQPGQMSEPVKTTVGWHIIKVEDRHPFQPYEYHRESILKFLDQRGIREASANALIDSLAKQEGVNREAIIGRFYDDLMKKDEESRYLAQEYYDGTLMYEICKTQIWDKAAADTTGMEAYFKANEKQYAWDAPRFRGIVIRAKDEATLKRAKALVKGVAVKDWPMTIVKALNSDSVKVVRVEHGIYKQGDSKAVDHFVFKQKNDSKPSKDYPAVGTVGKKLKKPESYADVRGQVTTDYQGAQERQWVEGLRKKYSYDVDEAVLQTVNKH